MRSSMKWVTLWLAVAGCEEWGLDIDPEPPPVSLPPPTEPNTPPAGTDVVGRFRFEAPTPTCDSFGCFLDYAAIQRLPVRHHRVLLLDAEGQTVATTHTDGDGFFGFAYDGPAQPLSVYVLAQAELPGQLASVTVSDNTDGLDWGASTAPFDYAGEPVTGLDFMLPHGHDGQTYQSRASGPFAITDTVLQASEAWLARDGAGALPHLTVYWSPLNVPESGDEAAGQIGTSFWRDSEGAIYLLGAEDVDTDEFDRHVVLHEWGHYFEDRVARSESPGGSHPFGEVLDPRLAFSEALATVLAKWIDPDADYIDTTGDRQQWGFVNDLTDASAHAPGWWSESAVERLVYGMGPGISGSISAGAISRDQMFELLAGPFRETPALTTVFAFVDVANDAHPEQRSATDARTELFGFDPVLDGWGTGETHDAGDPDNLPVYRVLAPGPAVQLTMDGTVARNRLGANRYLRVTAPGGALTIDATSDEDVDVFLYHRGQLLDDARSFCSSPPCVETVTASPPAGDEVVVYVQSWGEAPTYTVDVRIVP